MKKGGRAISIHRANWEGHVNRCSARDGAGRGVRKKGDFEGGVTREKRRNPGCARDRVAIKGPASSKFVVGVQISPKRSIRAHLTSNSATTAYKEKKSRGNSIHGKKKKTQRQPRPKEFLLPPKKKEWEIRRVAIPKKKEKGAVIKPHPKQSRKKGTGIWKKNCDRSYRSGLRILTKSPE